MIDPTRLAGSSGLIDAYGSTPAKVSTAATTPTDQGTRLDRGDGSSDVFALGKDDFFKLFLAQLRNQDPTQPMDDKEFLAQLAQFSLIDTMQQVSKSLAGTQLAQASALIGGHVQGTDLEGHPVAGIVDRIVQDEQGITLVLQTGETLKPDAVTQVTAPSHETPAPDPGA